MGNKAEERRTQILKATFDAIADKGYENVTLQDIADYAGVSKGVTNYYFKNKEDVFAHLLKWITSKIFAKESSSVKEKQTALEKLDAYLNTVFVSPNENRKFYQVYLDFLAQVKNHPEYKEINEKFYENCWNIGSEIVTLGQQEGVFKQGDPQDFAIMIRSMIDGCLIQWLMREDDGLHEVYKRLCYEAIIGFLTKNE